MTNYILFAVKCLFFQDFLCKLSFGERPHNCFYKKSKKGIQQSWKIVFQLTVIYLFKLFI